MIDLDADIKWIRAKEFHVNVHKYYWNTMLRDVVIRVREIAYIECDGYINPPLGESGKEASRYAKVKE